MEGRVFGLRRFLDLAIEFRGRGLIEAGLLFKTQDPNGFEDSQCADSIGICGVFRRFEADRDMRLSSEIIDLVWLNVLDEPDEVGGVGEIPVMHEEVGVLLMGVDIKMIDTLGVERGGAPLHAMDLILLFQ